MLKKEILKQLLDSEGSFVSGEVLANKNSVSRNAVWKAICSLKNDGYKIVSAHNRGYCLLEGSHMLSTTEICRYLENKSLDVEVFDELDSTNSYAKRIVSRGLTNTTLVIADSQTSGRGRLGRSFYSPKGTGVYFSYVYKPKTGLASGVAVTSAAAVAVCRAIREVTGFKSGIKWVNDIYIDGKKVCGILCEAITELSSEMAQCIIVGIGINVSTVDFPEELVSKAGSLRVKNIDRNRLTASVVNHLETLIQGLDKRTFIDEYRRLSLVTGKTIIYTKNGVETKAVAVAIDDDGGLVVRHFDGTETTLNTGEISVKL